MNLPCLSPVVGLLYVHCCRAERLVGDDEVGHVELGLKVQLDGGVLATVLSLEGGEKGKVLLDIYMIEKHLKKFICCRTLTENVTFLVLKVSF